MIVKLRFDEKRTTQAAAKLLAFHEGIMSYLKLMKLLYLVERESLDRWGRPFTFDRPVSMPNGTVLSNTLNLMTEDSPEGEHTYWKKYVSRPLGDYEVKLLQEPEYDELSPKDCELIEQTFARFGGYDKWTLVEFTHTLPEWNDPHGSSADINYRDILEALKKTPEEISQILGEIQGLAMVDSLFT